MSGSQCDQRARTMAGALHTRLQGLGFRKRGLWLRKRAVASPLSVVQVLGVQLAQSAPGRECHAIISVGAGLLGLREVPVDAERVRPRDCLWSERLGDHWVLEDDLREVVGAVAEQAETWFAERATQEQLLAPFAERDLGSVGAWLGQVNAVAAAWVALGESDRARALLDARRAKVSGNNLTRADEFATALFRPRYPEDDV